MLTLYLFRHEKTEKSAPVDFERHLTAVGQEKALRTAAVLKEKNYLPEIVLASKAVRAQETFMLFKKVSGYCSEEVHLKELYCADVEEAIKTAAKYGMGKSSVMLIGHNPELEIITRIITNREITMKPGNVVVIDLNISSWDQSFVGKGKIRDFIALE